MNLKKRLILKYNLQIKLINANLRKFLIWEIYTLKQGNLSSG